jgi:serine/threonine protein kinase
VLAADVDECGSGDQFVAALLRVVPLEGGEQPIGEIGELGALGPRSDVYSLGATLYCLLTGRPPYEGDDIGEVLRRVQKGDFASPWQLDPAINRSLGAVCLKAMALKAEDRYEG